MIILYNSDLLDFPLYSTDICRTPPILKKINKYFVNSFVTKQIKKKGTVYLPGQFFQNRPLAG